MIYSFKRFKTKIEHNLKVKIKLEILNYVTHSASLSNSRQNNVPAAAVLFQLLVNETLKVRFGIVVECHVGPEITSNRRHS